MIPNHFPTHWRAAINGGDLSGFTAREDLIEFFMATSNQGCFQALSSEQRQNVAEARNEPTNAHLEAMLRLHGKEAQTEHQKAENLAASINGGEQQQTKAAASSWDRVIARVNAQRGQA